MLFNFQKQFAPKILDGTKRGTIRLPRKDGQICKPGELCHLYTGLRQPGAKLLGRSPCRFTTRVTITAKGWAHDSVLVDQFCGWIESLPAEISRLPIKEAFAQGDGFTCWDDLVEFFKPHPTQPTEAMWTTWLPLAQDANPTKEKPE